jgi:hypothetical protein
VLAHPLGLDGGPVAAVLLVLVWLVDLVERHLAVVVLDFLQFQSVVPRQGIVLNPDH